MEMEWKLGARYMFDEMTASLWRSPCRVLEVNIHKVCYPMTEQVIRLVFEPFGSVEHVEVFVESNRVCAQVVFQTKKEATDAFGDLHGRCVYDGCCQLDIQYGALQESDIVPVKSNGDIIPASGTSIECVSDIHSTESNSNIGMKCGDISFTSDVDSEASDADSEASAAGALDFVVAPVTSGGSNISNDTLSPKSIQRVAPTTSSSIVATTTTLCSYGDASSDSEASAAATFSFVCSGLELGVGSNSFGLGPLGVSMLPPVPDTVDVVDVSVGAITVLHPDVIEQTRTWDPDVDACTVFLGGKAAGPAVELVIQCLELQAAQGALLMRAKANLLAQLGKYQEGALLRGNYINSELYDFVFAALELTEADCTRLLSEVFAVLAYITPLSAGTLGFVVIHPGGELDVLLNLNMFSEDATVSLMWFTGRETVHLEFLPINVVSGVMGRGCVRTTFRLEWWALTRTCSVAATMAQAGDEADLHGDEFLVPCGLRVLESPTALARSLCAERVLHHNGNHSKMANQELAVEARLGCGISELRPRSTPSMFRTARTNRSTKCRMGLNVVREAFNATADTDHLFVHIEALQDVTAAEEDLLFIHGFISSSGLWTDAESQHKDLTAGYIAIMPFVELQILPGNIVRQFYINLNGKSRYPEAFTPEFFYSDVTLPVVRFLQLDCEALVDVQEHMLPFQFGLDSIKTLTLLAPLNIAMGAVLGQDASTSFLCWTGVLEADVCRLLRLTTELAFCVSWRNGSYMMAELPAVPWDPGGVKTVAWGQAAFQGERNVSTQLCQAGTPG